MTFLNQIKGEEVEFSCSSEDSALIGAVRKMSERLRNEGK